MDDRTAPPDRELRPRDAGGVSDGVAARAAGLLGARPGERVLDSGCGGGGLLKRLADSGAWGAGLDLCPVQLGRVRAAGARGARGDAARLPFRDGVFDAAASLLVLHYLPDPERATRELARVLRPGGRLVLADRVGAEDPVRRSLHDALERLRNPRLGRMLPPSAIERLLGAAGFRGCGEGEGELALNPAAWVEGAPEGEAGRLREALAQVGERDLGGLRLAGGRLYLRVRYWSAMRV